MILRKRYLPIILLLFFLQLSEVLANPTPGIVAHSYILYDVDSGTILSEQDADLQLEPASTTKLMTAYLVFGALENGTLTLDQELPVSEHAWKMPGSKMFIDPRMRVRVEDLIKGMLVQSGNDATNVLAEGVGGSIDGFVDMMNVRAAEIGMKHTVFKNPEGLPQTGHLSTARDLAALAIRIIEDFPAYLGYFQIKNYHYPGTPLANGNNRNQLLFRDPTVDGMKTGHTEAAGYCLVATAMREVPGYGKRRLVSVLMGASNKEARATNSQKLLNWGFSANKNIKVLMADQALQSVQIWKGVKDDLYVGSLKNQTVSVPADMADQIVIERRLNRTITAPIDRGDVIGEIQVHLAGEMIKTVDIVALETVPDGGWIKILWDTIYLFALEKFEWIF